MGAPLWLIGGLGEPHDRLAAAALGGEGHPAQAVGALDQEAYDRGRSALPRGQCAPLIYTTGALLRKVEEQSASGPLTWISPRTCGPCRYALFESAWRRALLRSGHDDVRVLGIEQSIESLQSLLSPAGAWRVLDALLVADVLREIANRLRPRVLNVEGLERLILATTTEIAAMTRAGASPVEALRDHAPALRELPLRPPAPLARAQLIGDPWSLHVDGDGQLNLVRLLAAAGVEVEQPPFALWLDYLAWQRRAAPFGDTPAPSPSEIGASRALESRLHDRLESVSAAAGLGAFALPSQDELAVLAAPHLPSSIRGGYGHIEVALAIRARHERRAHVVFSVKSFGCIPSSGISDAIVPTVLGADMHFLAVEVSGDGDAARESRIMLRVGSAIDAAEREFADAMGLDSPAQPELLDPGEAHPLDGRWEIGPRPYACTLACGAQREARR